jgi:hypothetical protein
MAGYKVSYKILRQQGEDMKAVAKLVDGYSERVTQISGKLGSDHLLAEVRSNLGKLREQLLESRTVLNTAGEFLVNTVESYTGAEIRQVKKTDGTRAHNRDFYKNPVVVASVGGAAAGGAAAMPSPAASAAAPAATTVNYADNSVNVNYVSVESAPAAADATPAAFSPVTADVPQGNTVPASMSASSAAAAAPTVSVPAGVTADNIGSAGVAAAAGIAGAAVGAGTVIGAKHLKGKDKKVKAKDNSSDDGSDDYNPEEELEMAIRRVKALETE